MTLRGPPPPRRTGAALSITCLRDRPRGRFAPRAAAFVFAFGGRPRRFGFRTGALRDLVRAEVFGFVLKDDWQLLGNGNSRKCASPAAHQFRVPECWTAKTVKSRRAVHAGQPLVSAR